MSAMKVRFHIVECSHLLHEKRGLGKAVEPSLMVKKDGLILEKNLRFKGELVGFRRSLNAKEVFRKPFSRPIYKKIKHIF